MRYVGQDHVFARVALVGVCLCLAVALFGAALASVVAWPLAPVLVAGLVFAALCMHRPLVCFLLALALQVFDQLLILVPATSSGSASLINSITVPKMMFAALFAMLLPRIMLTKDEAPLWALRRQGLFVMLTLLFLLGCLPGLIYAGSDNSAMAPLSRLINCVMMALTAIALIRDYRALVLVFVVLIPSFVVTGVMGAYEVTTETYVLDMLDRPIPEDFAMSAEAGAFRVMGPSGDPVYYAVSLCFAVMAVLVAMQLTRRRWLLVLCLGFLGLFALGIVSTASRGALLALGVFSVVFFGLATVRHKWIIAGTTAGILALGIIFYSVAISSLPLARFMGKGGADEGTTNRLGFWSQCIRMIEDSPLFGVGMGSFPEYHVAVYFDSRTPQRPYLPHNVYLQIPAENGLGNLALYLAILAVSTIPLFVAILRMPPSPQRNVAVSILAGVLGLASFATNTNLRENEMLWLLMALAGVASHVCREAHAQSLTAPVQPPRRPATRRHVAPGLPRVEVAR